MSTLKMVARAIFECATMTEQGFAVFDECDPDTKFRWYNMAQAAITAHLAHLQARGMVIVPKEPINELNGVNVFERPTTAEQMAQLPEGPLYGFREYELTDADRQRGYVELGGKRHNLVVPARRIKIPVAPSVVAVHHDETDVVGYTDEAGASWTLGRYADGRWFRQRR